MDQAKEKIGKAGELLEVCNTAELPFLKGDEVLPEEVTKHVFLACDAAAQKAQSAVSQASAFLKQKLVQAKPYVRDPSGAPIASLADLQEQCPVAPEKTGGR